MHLLHICCGIAAWLPRFGGQRARSPPSILRGTGIPRGTGILRAAIQRVPFGQRLGTASSPLFADTPQLTHWQEAHFQEEGTDIPVRFLASLLQHQLTSAKMPVN